jgi:hypothetical protein
MKMCFSSNIFFVLTLLGMLHLHCVPADPNIQPLVYVEPTGPVDPYNYTCSKVERLSGRCRWCNREVPNAEGVWASVPPYWQHRGACANQAFDAEDTSKCLRGRTVYAIGNSVARQGPFNLMEMLGEKAIDRETQKILCPKLAATWEESCAKQIEGINFRYLYFQYLDGLRYEDRGGFPFFRYKVEGEEKVADLPNATSSQWMTGKIERNSSGTGSRGSSGEGDSGTGRGYLSNPHEADADRGDPLWLEDNCSDQDVRECLAHFFKSSTERDILIFTLGMPYGSGIGAMGGKEPWFSPGIDYEAWLRASAVAFKGHLTATFPGQVFRVTHAEFRTNDRDAARNPGLQRVNEVLWDLYRPDSSQRPWYTVDQWEINRNRHGFYNDHVHFSGKLTKAMLHQVLNELCPGGGRDAWQFPEPGETVLQAIVRQSVLPPAAVAAVATVLDSTGTKSEDSMGSGAIQDGGGGDRGGNQETKIVARKQPIRAFICQAQKSASATWFAVLYNGTRHSIPNLDTLAGLEGTPETDLVLLWDEFIGIPEGVPVEPCDPSLQVCNESVYYKAIHGLL